MIMEKFHIEYTKLSKRQHIKTKNMWIFFSILLLSFYSYVANSKNSSQIVLHDSIASPVNDTCDMCYGKGVIFVPCKYCAGTGNATYISEWRRKHDVDYWVCEHCRGRKGFYQKCPKCNKDK